MVAFDNDKSVGAIVVTGSEKAFAGGFLLILAPATLKRHITLVIMTLKRQVAYLGWNCCINWAEIIAIELFLIVF